MQHYQKYFLVISFFLKFLLLVMESGKFDKDRIDFDSVTAVIEKRTVMFIHRKINLYLDEKRKQDMYYAMEALLQMMNTIQVMALAADYAAIAENLQNNLFYEVRVQAVS